MAQSVYFWNFIESSEKIRISTGILWHGLELAFSEARPQPLTPRDPVLQQKSFVSPLWSSHRKRDREVTTPSLETHDLEQLKFCLTKGYRISCPFLGSYPGFFQGKTTDHRGLNFKLCLVLCSLLQCYTPALLPCGEPGPHARGKVYANTNQSAQAYFLRTLLKR